MTDKSTSTNEDIQALLVEAVEVQLAAFNASISSWADWVQEASRFSEETIQRLNELRSEPIEEGRLLLELSEITRGSLRSMNQMPRRAAESFIRELDKLQEARLKGDKGRRTKPKAKRSARVKT